MKVKSPLEIYKYLPKTNCAECGYDTCMSFAANIIERKVKPADCPFMLEEKFKDKLMELEDLTSPEIKEVVIGVGKNAVTIGGDDVLFRHDLTFFNPTALAYDVWDTMPLDKLEERINTIKSYTKFYVGNFINLDMIAVRCVSNDPLRFKEVAEKAAETGLPLILVSFSPEVLRAALESIGNKRPLIYAATEENWQEIARLAKEFEVPVVLYSKDLATLQSLAVTFSEMGIQDLVLDPGTEPVGKGLQETFKRVIQLRRAAIEGGNKKVAYPIMVVPMTAWLIESDKLSTTYWETVVASVFIVKYADIMILHSLEPYEVMPLVILKTNIYTDPRKPVAVEGGLRTINSPDENSPVFITTNFALTYYTVESDLVSAGVDCYLLVIDTEGLGVEVSVAGGKLTASVIKETIEKEKVTEKINHNSIILPGLAARLQGELEMETGMKVLVGPVDSGRIPGWLEENWPPK